MVEKQELKEFGSGRAKVLRCPGEVSRDRVSDDAEKQRAFMVETNNVGK